MMVIGKCSFYIYITIYYNYYEFTLGLLELKSDKVQEDRSGLMAQCTKDGGRIIKQMVQVD